MELLFLFFLRKPTEDIRPMCSSPSMQMCQWCGQKKTLLYEISMCITVLVHNSAWDTHFGYGDILSKPMLPIPCPSSDCTSAQHTQHALQPSHACGASPGCDGPPGTLSPGICSGQTWNHPACAQVQLLLRGGCKENHKIKSAIALAVGLQVCTSVYLLCLASQW